MINYISLEKGKTMNKAKLVSRELKGNILYLVYEGIEIGKEKFLVKFAVDLEGESVMKHTFSPSYGFTLSSEGLKAEKQEVLFSVVGDVTLEKNIETKKMTLKEIERKLGCKIELIS